MAGDTVITIIGNLTADPELRFTPSGAAVANFTVASTPRAFDRQSNEWKDGESLFLSCSVWRQYAENVAESLTKGTRVTVQHPMETVRIFGTAATHIHVIKDDTTTQTHPHQEHTAPCPA